MQKLSGAIDRFCRKHPYWGIPGLMRYVVMATAAVYLLYLLLGFNGNVINLMAYSAQRILHGEIWRIVSFAFLPVNLTNPILLVLSLYFYYWIGNALENYWGTPKFTIFYISGVLLTAIGGLAATLITGHDTILFSNYYVNMSMFFAFAALYPNAQVLLFFVIPVKIKWLAYLDAALFAIDIVSAIGSRDLGGVIMPVIAALNFLVFFWSYFSGRITYTRQTARAKTAARRFHEKIHQAEAQQPKGYRHKCAVCGKTDTEYPNLSFRYCSRCAGYHCYCEEHIFNHVHFTEDTTNN